MKINFLKLREISSLTSLIRVIFSPLIEIRYLNVPEEERKRLKLEYKNELLIMFWAHSINFHVQWNKF